MADAPVSNNFINEVREELKKVTWPSRRQLIRLTLVVIVVSLIVAFYAGGLDIILAKALELLTTRR